MVAPCQFYLAFDLCPLNLHFIQHSFTPISLSRCILLSSTRIASWDWSVSFFFPGNFCEICLHFPFKLLFFWRGFLFGKFLRCIFCVNLVSGLCFVLCDLFVGLVRLACWLCLEEGCDSGWFHRGFVGWILNFYWFNFGIFAENVIWVCFKSDVFHPEGWWCWFWGFIFHFLFIFLVRYQKLCIYFGFVALTLLFFWFPFDNVISILLVSDLIGLLILRFQLRILDLICFFLIAFSLLESPFLS